MKKLLLAGMLLLVACAPRTLNTDPEYLSAYAQAPRLNVACVGESNRPGPLLEYGSNVCTLVVYPTVARDAVRAEYAVTLFYRTPVGNLLSPRYENKTHEIKGEAPLNPNTPATASFPVYVPDRNFFRVTGRILEGTFKVVLSLAPAALGNYLGIPIPAVGLDKTTSGLYAQVNTAINDLVNNREEVYALEVSARVCGPQLCSPYQNSTVRLPQ
jgi:hypothetical protein